MNTPAAQSSGQPSFDHEKLDVYRVGLEFVAWCFEVCSTLLPIYRDAKGQLLRSSQSIVQNIAEGNGKRSAAERKRYFEIARGSGMESAATIDVLRVCRAIELEVAVGGKRLLHRVVSMLTRMTERQEEAPAERV